MRLKCTKILAPTKLMLVVFTETWQHRAEIHKNTYGGNVIKATSTENKFPKYPMMQDENLIKVKDNSKMGLNVPWQNRK